MQNKRATYAWLAESTGDTFVDWNIKQSPEDFSIILDPNYEPRNDATFDFDEMKLNCGAWKLPQASA